jgi:DNA-directed RNA polymerase specialized sigma24 family protein
MHGNWIRSRCRLWSNTKFDFDDLWQECLLVVSHIVTHHSDLGIENPSFRNVLYRSVKNRILDINRRFKTQSRNRFLEVSYESSIDDDQIAEASAMTSLPVQPDELIEAIQLAQKLEEKLNQIDRLMLRQLLDPSSELIQKFREHEKVAATKGHRRSVCRNGIPVVLIGSEAGGMSYKQALKSIERIRRTLTQILFES